MTLADLGWCEWFEQAFAPLQKQGWKPARLIRDNRITYGALLGDGEEREVVMGGKVYHDATSDAELPAVGDWVALELGGEGEETVIRANTHLRGKTRIGRGCVVGPNSILTDATIGDGANVVASVIDGVSVEPGSRIGPFSNLCGAGGAVPRRV